MSTLKTPTSILFNKAENFHSFGYEAEKKYAQLAENAQKEQVKKTTKAMIKLKKTALLNCFNSKDLK